MRNSLPAEENLTDVNRTKESSELTGLLELGDSYFQQNELDLALLYYEKYLSEIEESNLNEYLCNVYRRIGNIHYNRSNALLAQEFYQKSLDSALKQRDEEEQALALSGIGNSYWLQGAYEKAVAEYLAALLIYESRNDKDHIAYIYNNIGTIKTILSKTDEAQSYYEKALHLYQETKNLEGEARVYNRLGELNHKLKNYQQAIKYYYRAQDLYNRIDPYSTNPNLLSAIGITFMDMGDRVMAAEYIENSLRLCRQQNNRWCLARNLMLLGKLDLYENNLENARINLEESIRLAREIDAKELIVFSATILDSLFNREHDYRKAYENYRLYKTLDDSLKSIEREKIITELEIEYNAEKREREIEIYKLEIEKNNLTKWLLICLFLLAMIFIFIIYYRYRQKNKANIMLRQLSDELESEVQKRTAQLEKINHELQKSEREYRELIANLEEGFIIVDREDVFTFVNPAAARIFGYPVEYLMGKSIADFTDPQEAARVISFTELRRKGISSRYETFITDKNGITRYIQVSATPLFNNGDFQGTSALFIDITERKNQEKKIKSSLEEKEILLKEIHHRVKNNMQIISSMLKLQSRYTKDKKTLEMFQESFNRVKSMSIIHEKLYLSTNLKKIDFTDYIRSLVRFLYNTYIQKGDHFSLYFDISDIFLDLNKAIPCGLIVNELVSNSLKHAFKGKQEGKITISLKGDTKENYTLIVADNGCGFPADIDYQNTSTLGLQIVNTLVKQIHGNIEMSSKNGTQFRIKFSENSG
ncbi:MAG: tetratricopeptide repeat protein [Candidatus Cloacimonetes bacterium]|nr:tetratricopeptide repeat protein [Candidatus Cloacimonadota bacterium]